MDTITKAIADQWTGHHCWLDDKPAKITGRLNPHATIATTDGKQAIEFSWHTVNRIMQAKKEFRS